MDWREWYKTGQGAYGLRVGEKVKVLGRAQTAMFGWDNNWNDSKTNMIGKEGRINRIVDDTYYLDLDMGNGFPFFLLERVDEKLSLPPDVSDLIERENFGCAKEPVKKLVAKILKIKSSQG